MSSLSHTTLSATVRRLLADRRTRSAASARRRKRTGADRRRTPSTTTLRHELDSFRKAQGAPYWHHDQRGG
jgi:hypothetical protein